MQSLSQVLAPITSRNYPISGLCFQAAGVGHMGISSGLVHVCCQQLGSFETMEIALGLP